MNRVAEFQLNRIIRREHPEMMATPRERVLQFYRVNGKTNFL